MKEKEQVADAAEPRPSAANLMLEIENETIAQNTLRNSKKEQKKKFYEKEIQHRGHIDEFGKIIQSKFLLIRKIVITS